MNMVKTMAIRPDWNIGTITLIEGSDSFTTANALLNLSAAEAGDTIITPSGDVLIISAITGQNSGTLFLPCPPSAAGANQPLRIRFQPDGSRYQGAIRDLMARWGQNGNVDAFAGLEGVDGQVPIFTGAGTMGLADFKATETAINNRVRFDAAQDLNASQQNQARQNINALGRSGGTLSDQLTFKFGDGTYNIKPISFGWGNKQFGTWGVYLGKDNNLSFGVDNPDTGGWIRGVLDLTENGYAHFPNMPSANGSPIVQSGSNANGKFVRFADGTQICVASSLIVQTDNPAGNIFMSNPIAFVWPASFAGRSFGAAAGAYVAGSVAWPYVNSSSTGGGSLRGFSYNSNAQVEVTPIGFGRWF